MEILTTDSYDTWIRKLKDASARSRINLSLRRSQLAGRMTGDVKAVGDHVFEIRFHFGPGYRVYYAQNGETLVLLLAGGDRSTQRSDIARARQLAEEIRKDMPWP